MTHSKKSQYGKSEAVKTTVDSLCRSGTRRSSARRLLKPKHTWLTFATGTGLDADMVVAADPRKPIRREDFGRKEAGERRVDVAAKGLAGAGVGTTQRTRRRKQKRAGV